MPAIHDRGGWPGAGPIEQTEHHLADWEMHTDAIMRLLSSSPKRIIRVDELRRSIESLEPERYEASLYYEKWSAAIEALLIQKEILTRDEIEDKIAEQAARQG